MKDKQAPAGIPTGRIPIISPILHCLSMPVLVILRHSFGYSFLSPKSIFLASSFVTCLFAFAVWHDEDLKARFLPLAVFALLAAGLYFIHLVSGIIKQARGNAEHDQYAGNSYLIGFRSPQGHETRRAVVQGLIEPLLTVSVGYFMSPNPLGKVLIVSGIALAFKELIRNWLTIRTKKRVADNLEDARSSMEDSQAKHQKQELPTTGRTPKERFPSNHDREA